MFRESRKSKQGNKCTEKVFFLKKSLRINESYLSFTPAQRTKNIKYGTLIYAREHLIYNYKGCSENF